MQRKNYKAYFTVEAAVLYPIVLGVEWKGMEWNEMEWN